MSVSGLDDFGVGLVDFVGGWGRISFSWLWCCEKFCGRFGGCGFEFRDGGFFFGEILVVAEKWVEIVGWGFESVEAGV